MREAYIEIVKIVHPDSGHPEASAEKFTEVDNAFRILQAKYAKDRRGIKETDEIKEYDIKVWFNKAEINSWVTQKKI